jgi:hypothetical protein
LRWKTQDLENVVHNTHRTYGKVSFIASIFTVPKFRHGVWNHATIVLAPAFVSSIGPEHLDIRRLAVTIYTLQEYGASYAKLFDAEALF